MMKASMKPRAMLGVCQYFPSLSCLLMLLCLPRVAICHDTSIQYRCPNEITKLTNCFDFAAGKTDEPAGSCCTSVLNIRQRDAVCLCFLVQQTHAGSPGFKSLGLQFPRMLALLGDCKIGNSSITECPKLLNIPPSSPDYSIFTNTIQGASTSSGSTTTTTSSSPISDRAIHRICVRATIAISLISSIFFSIF